MADSLLMTAMMLHIIIIAFLFLRMEMYIEAIKRLTDYIEEIYGTEETNEQN